MGIPSRMKLPVRNFREKARQTVATPFFSLKVRSNTLGRNRIGIIAGTAVHKNAAQRNFWRRQAGEILRTAKKDYGDALIILFPKVTTLTRKQFRERLSAAIRELR